MKKILFVLVLLIAHCTLYIDNCFCVWEHQICGSSTTSIASLASIGNFIVAGTFYEGIYFSQNNGNTWTHSDFNNMYTVIYSLASNDNNIFAGTSGYIYRSTNNGVNWFQASQIITGDVGSLITKGNYILGGDNNYTISISSNNGANWYSKTLNHEYILSFAVKENKIFTGTSGLVYQSTDNGNSWTQTALNNHWTLSLTVSGNNIFAGTLGQGVYRSTNDGTSWTQAGLSNRYIFALASVGSYILAGDPDSGISITSNNGATWKTINEGFTNITAIYSFIIKDNYIFVATGGQSIWRRSLAEIIGVQNISSEVPSEYKLYQNFPNPFNPVTKIRFDIRAGVRSQSAWAEEVKLIIFDITGREIQTLVNETLEPGSYEVTFDASNLPSGIYFYKLIANDFVENKKLVLIK